MSEAKLWKLVREGILSVEPYAHLMRVESGISPGAPDVNYCIDGTEGWIELKYRDRYPARTTTSVFATCGLRPAQRNWVTKRHAQGGNAYILCQVEYDTFLISARHADMFNKLDIYGLSSYADWSSNTIKPHDWQALAHILTRKHYYD